MNELLDKAKAALEETKCTDAMQDFFQVGLVRELAASLERVEALIQKWDNLEHLVARAFASEVRDALQVEESGK
ncbi:hypothetical protein [Mycobacteroides chelonae]|uniref:hypothetical protein n=1 Tax=Mycobacteroides chelonae TaxID=1774 RepID=UPI0008A9913E|nr:hypothetical protein [Mycobacteroides chelonae]OHT47904.1 hypothetical protein BKG63_24050 [Mycobacteroides chelonae]OHT99549.1 hypothetical protein BKG72_03720 [Mycobacteroides chelonae]OLT92918.1 hypothetical protein BKG59_05660 [Mycobacteroides chelonae]